MKETVKKFISVLTAADASISFEVRFWDRETFSYGTDVPAFVLRLKTKNAVKRIFAN